MDSFQLAVKIIAVVFGVLGGGFIGNVIGPWITKTRRGQSGSLVGGAFIGGLIMWLAITHSGSGGYGLGSGSNRGGTGTGTGTSTEKDRGVARNDSKDKNGKAIPAPRTVEIDVLGGERVREQRFYVLGHAKPMTRAELEKAILEKKHENPALKEVEIRLYTDSVAKDSEAVTGLEEWATKQGFTPKVQLLQTPAP